MPNGRLRPVAKVEILSADPFVLRPRRTRTRPGSLSATKMSPLGAVRSRRGLSRPLAYSDTAYPATVFGRAPAGRGTTVGGLFEARVARGAGRSATLMRCTVPGTSRLKSENAAGRPSTFGAL